METINSEELMKKFELTENMLEKGAGGSDPGCLKMCNEALLQILVGCDRYEIDDPRHARCVDDAKYWFNYKCAPRCV